MNFFEFAAFFPCFKAQRLVKYACKVTSSGCLNASVWMQHTFTAVHKALPKCMPKKPCVMCRESRSAFRTCKVPFPRDRGRSLYRGFESRRVPILSAYRQWFGFCPQGKQNEHSCAAAVKQFNCHGGSRMQALPVYGYRATSSKTKRLSFRLGTRALKYTAAYILCTAV